MRILIANDDGIYSPGILALAEVAASFGDVRIVAPDMEQSSMGHAVTHSRPLSYRRTIIAGFEAFRVNGTPADCVALGLSTWEGADIVLAGINLGTNLGNSMWHSGTLAAAKQAALLRKRGIAFSVPVDEHGEPNLERAKPFVARILEQLLPDRTLNLINVNIPDEPRGVAWTRQSVRHYAGRIVPGQDPMGRQHYWFTVVPVEEAEEGTDRWAFKHDLVSVTPLRLDLTDTGALAASRIAHPFG